MAGRSTAPVIVQQHRAVHLAGQADALDRGQGRGVLAPQTIDDRPALPATRHPDPARYDPGDGRCTDSGTASAADHLLRIVHQQRLDRRGAEIEAEEQGARSASSGGQRMPGQVRQRFAGLLEQMACGRIDREADLLVGARRIAAFDLHRHLQIALGLDVQRGSGRRGARPGRPWPGSCRRGRRAGPRDESPR